MLVSQRVVNLLKKLKNNLFRTFQENKKEVFILFFLFFVLFLFFHVPLRYIVFYCSGSIHDTQTIFVFDHPYVIPCLLPSVKRFLRAVLLTSKLSKR